MSTTMQQQQLHLHTNLPYPKPNIIQHFLPHKKFQLKTKQFPTHNKTQPLLLKTNYLHIKKFPLCNAISYENESNINVNVIGDNDNENENKNSIKNQKNDGKSFWGAVSLIIGAAVGPGMLGLPSLTIKSGPIPSTIIILISWLYVISSIILVAELCYDAMENDNVDEVSFTSLATRTLGKKFGSFVALIYTSLCFSLLVACVAGIGSILSPILPQIFGGLIIHSIFPLFVGILIVFFPFNTIDIANRVLCFLMVFSITGLVLIGIVVARANIISSFSSISWKISSILPIIPVAVLTLGFHVITPFICKIAGNSVDEARKAILIGGTVPLVMVLSWNLIVLGLVGTNKGTNTDPISLLLSVNPSALSAVQGFAFSAMATSLVGYAVSLPKQILDTLELVFGKGESCDYENNNNEFGNGRVGLVFYSGGGGGGDGGADSVGYSGKVEFRGSRDFSVNGSEMRLNEKRFDGIKVIVTLLVLLFSVLIASYFQSTFSRALDFAGVYANCFLFGIIPPVMTYIHQQKSKKNEKFRPSFIPGGNVTLLLLFIISVILGIWH